MNVSEIANLSKDQLISIITSISMNNPGLLRDRAVYKLAYDKVVRQLKKLAFDNFPVDAFIIPEM